MKLNKYIERVLKKFYILSQVPAKSFSYEGVEIASAGMTPYLEEEYRKAGVYNIINQELDGFVEKTITKNNVHFTLMSICPKNKHRGIFVIGPYTSNENNRNIAYKPLALEKYMVGLISTIWLDFPKSSFMPVTDDPYSFHIKKSIDYIDSRYMDNIKLDDVAEYLDINKSYFCSLFKKETQMTFTQYLNNVRVAKSKELLLNENYSVLDIALAVGYNNQNYYNIIFKRLTDKTPLEYRNRNVS